MNGPTLNNRPTGKLLNHLTSKEFSIFERWFSKQQDGRGHRALDLLRALAYRPAMGWPVEKVWIKLYPKKPFSESRFNRDVHDLKNYLEKFLSEQRLLNSPLNHRIAFLEEINIRKIQGAFEPKYKEFNKTWDEIPAKGTKGLYTKYLATKSYQESLLWQKKKEQHDYPNLIKTFDDFWMLEKLIIGCAAQLINIRPGQNNTHIKNPLMNVLLSYIDSMPKPRTIGPLQMYRKVYGLLSKEKGVAFNKVKKLFFNNLPSLSPSDQSSILSVLLNLCVFDANQKGNDNRVNRRLFEVFEKGFEHGIFFNNGYLEEGHYKNYVVVCLRAKEYEHAHVALEKYKQKLPPGQAEDIYKYNLALYYFAIGEWRKVRGLLQGKKFDDPRHDIPARILYLQIDYEEYFGTHIWKNKKVDLLNSIGRFLTFLDNLSKKFDSYQLPPFFNRITLYKRLVLAESKEELMSLSDDINTTRPLDNAAWLRKKVAERL